MLTSNSFSFSLPVWRVCFESFDVPHLLPYAVIELRDQQQVAWAGVDVENGIVMWNQAMTDDWWTSLIGVFNGYALFHRYADQTQPSPRGITVVDTKTGKIAWEINGRTFVKATVEGIQTVTHNAQLQSTWDCIDWQGNDIVGTILVEESKDDVDWQQPDCYEENQHYYPSLKKFIKDRVGHEAQKRIFYAEIAGNVVFSYYFYQSNAYTLSHSLLVVDSSKTVQWHKPLLGDAAQPVFEAFAIYKNRMMYLSHSNEITLLNFSQ